MAGLKGEKSQINWILLFQTHIYIKYYLSINIVAFVVLNQSTLVTQFAIVSVTMDAAHRVNILILLKYIGYLLKECLVFFFVVYKTDWLVWLWPVPLEWHLWFWRVHSSRTGTKNNLCNDRVINSST